MRNNKPKPPLATANQPFTPMTHKTARPADTPFHLLKLGDLATPVLNKSHSSADHDIIDSPEEKQEFAQTDSDLNELKNTLLHAISIIDKIEASKKSNTAKLKNAQTQTEVEKSSPKQTYFSSSESTEISINDSSDSMTIAKKTDKKPKRNSNQQFSDSINITTPKPHKSSTRISTTQSSGERIEEKALQERMHDLSLLLKRLENQLDEMNQSDSD
ncbi:hypothetical protein GPJ56_000536 [Histomonas meleagridis]|uniref:uncharacterized protein n=1 Tax=Histomonas meleagridis TaxID=135588 RepID=UPI003559E491|nr:hypothetical protein GPJ56_000536 [Histomonas meleagridis]KAH0796424.1 hypothetical protein GO595_010317 [Histomonas meleagridis]